MAAFFPHCCMCASVLSHFSNVQLYATPWTTAFQAPLSMGFSRQEYWRGLPCPSPGTLPHSGIEHTSVIYPALASRFFTTVTTWEDLHENFQLSLLYTVHY